LLTASRQFTRSRGPERPGGPARSDDDKPARTRRAAREAVLATVMRLAPP
jgi:hypothetical protein